MSVVIGKFTGKCCDSNVVNNNGMFLSNELFDNLISSDEYKSAMENRHYIGFLGHPDDPNCMDYRNACIVMTNMSKEDNGDITGEFDLIDTPVGKVVKAFIDAGVHFGISIRGAGDIEGDGTVDPETFVFRGFDLVTFPAYNDCIPEFQEIAASTDTEKQKKYKKVCASVKKNLKDITSCEALDIIQSQFNDKSDEFSLIEDRKCELEDEKCENIDKEKLNAVLDLYLDQLRVNKDLSAAIDDLESKKYEAACCSRTLQRIQRITAAQTKDLQDTISSLESSLSKNKRVNQKIKASLSDKIDEASKNEKRAVKAETQLKEINTKISEIKDELSQVKSSNLIYRRKITASENEIAERDSTISNLRKQLSETVTASKKSDRMSLNLNESVKNLQSKIKCYEQIISDYQQAYADLCAGAIGVHLENISIDCSTTVKQLRDIIYGSTSTSNIPARPNVQLEQIDILDEDDEELVSM